MKALNPGKVLVLGGLLILMTITTISCSDRERPANPTSDQGSGVPTIFEKGKTYGIVLSVFPAGNTWTVVDIGPHPWLKVKDKKGDEFWINSNQIVMVMVVPQ